MSEIKVNSVVNSTGDNDSGIDLSTNDQIILKTANTTAITVDSSQVATFAQPPVGTFISEADQFRLTSDLTSNADPISSNLERVDDATFAKIGTGMSVSSGIFTFPSTGLYLVKMFATGNATLNDNVTLKLFATQNNSNYDALISTLESGDAGTGSYFMSGETFVNVTDTSNVKVQFQASSINSGSTLQGDTDQNKTYFTFIKLGQSQ